MSHAPQHDTASTEMTASAARYLPTNSTTGGGEGYFRETAHTRHTTTERARRLDDEQMSDRGPSSRIHLEPELANNSDIDHELAGLDALEDGLPGERPAYPFTTLIRYAIKGSPKGRLLLEEIYQAIQTRYPFFVTAPAGWKNSVRHTLSLMTCFEKVPRLLTEPGKGSYWTVNDSVPHAKPSRVRVRKRKTRIDGDDSSPDTPISTLDTFQPETESTNMPLGGYYYKTPFGWPEDLSRRHSSYAASIPNDRGVDYHRESQDPYRYDNASVYRSSERIYAPEYRTRSQITIEPTSHNVYDSHSRAYWADQTSEFELDKALANTPPSPEGPGSADSVDYRLVLMSELEKLRNVIGSREDIDQEWCRLMVERLKGTGLDF
ncbi:hypothetical protein FRC07_005219 [Ceratobasidium sp. 392]|nr:hypothetical protein FRC07_005219 [Ceratobasidium sp. 392]